MFGRKAPDDGRRPRFPVRLFAGIILFSVLTALIGGWQFWQLYTGLSESTARQLQLTDYIGRIMLLDEILTMSARMAAATGDFSYERRYDKYDAELDILIKGTAGLLDKPEVRRLVAATDDANQRLVAIERRSFRLTHDRRGSEALALLSSDEYLKLKKEYAGGMDGTRALAVEMLRAERLDLRNIAVVLITFDALSAVILSIAWGIAVRAASTWSRERIESEAAVRRSRDELELRVGERTADLAAYTKVVGALAAMMQRLQSCRSSEEIADIASRFAPQILKNSPGALYFSDAAGNRLRAVARWNDPAGSAAEFHPDQCWSLRRGQAHIVSDPGREVVCSHVDCNEVTGFSCRPLVARGELLGVLYLEGTPPASGSGAGNMAHDIDVFAENIALALGNQRLQEKLRDQSIRDPLTGLFNRRYFEETIGLEVARARRANSCFTVLMGDIDHFKHFNDTLGHDAGDLVLKKVAEVLQAGIRTGDLACRYGGEEFIVLLHNAGLAPARKRAETLRQTVKAMEVIFRGEKLERVTISWGIASFPLHAADAASLIRAADDAMYAAKGSGRDRVEIAPDRQGGGHTLTAAPEAAPISA